MEGTESMNSIEQEIIATLKRLESEARVGTLSAIIQCIGPVSEECGKEIRKLLEEDGK